MTIAISNVKKAKQSKKVEALGVQAGLAVHRNVVKQSVLIKLRRPLACPTAASIVRNDAR